MDRGFIKQKSLGISLDKSENARVAWSTPFEQARAYATQSTTTSPATGNATTTERKALATMGQKGGQKAAQRWQTDPKEKPKNDSKRLRQQTDAVQPVE